MMANNIRIQSSVLAHPQSGFNNWQALIRAQLKPTLVLRNATESERASGSRQTHGVVVPSLVLRSKDRSVKLKFRR